MQHRRHPETEGAEAREPAPPISAASAAGIFAEGSRFGAYVIGPCIGHGGMARIYRAEHEGLCRQVALKVLTEGVEPGTEGRARFLREARIAAAIKHPNVVNIFDIGVENQIPYLVMELLEGQDLEALLASHGALSEHTIIDIIVPVVAGLVAVHDAGVVHRDLKPGNIYLSRGPNDEVEPKLLDFGISKAIGPDKLRLTSTQGLLMGTPLYMSPEALIGTDMTPLSDQYSLGVVLYECATGVNPFIADTVAETARRVTLGHYTPISDQAIRPSRKLQAIIERTMSLDPRHRYPDMRALGQELLTLAGQRTRITWGLTFGEVAAEVRAHHARELDEESMALARTRAPRRAVHARRPWPIAAASAVALATVAALFFWSNERGAEEAEPKGAAQPVAFVPPEPVAPAAPPRPESPAPAPRSEAPAPAPAVVPDLAPAPEPPAPRAASTPPAAARPRPPRPRRARPARPEPAADQPAEPPETPEWLIERTQPRSPSSLSRSVQMGTNDAPIFE